MPNNEIVLITTETAIDNGDNTYTLLFIFDLSKMDDFQNVNNYVIPKSRWQMPFGVGYIIGNEHQSINHIPDHFVDGLFPKK